MLRGPEPPGAGSGTDVGTWTFWAPRLSWRITDRRTCSCPPSFLSAATSVGGRAPAARGAFDAHAFPILHWRLRKPDAGGNAHGTETGRLPSLRTRGQQIGRASCRERVCQYV